MLIDWSSFTPWSSLAGGLLMGIAAAILALFNGRIAGISGIIGGLLHLPKRDSGWRALFVVGLVGAPLLYALPFSLPRIKIDADYTSLILAGLMVGLGTRYGSGCTSGHGVCGLSRLSPRSAVATAAFMGAGFVTVYVLRHLIAN